ncbi:hypothetical protein Gasu2_00130 [Galdieria sulphuraria]|nr:hypothetical protein Gasu2_00130 [Galdieria sulphuraria]
MAPNIFPTCLCHQSLLVLADPIEERKVSVGFLVALHFALSSYKVTYLCDKERVEKDFEAALVTLSNPRCVVALRNIVFLYLRDVDDFLQVCVKAPLICSSDSVVVMPDLLQYFCLESCTSSHSNQKVLEGLALLNMFTKKQATTNEETTCLLQGDKGNPSFFICFITKPVTLHVMLNRLFDEETCLTPEQRKLLWQELEKHFSRRDEEEEWQWDCPMVLSEYLMASKPVLLLCDFQNDIMGFISPEKKESVLRGASKALYFAREKKIPVIHVGVRFRKGYPEISKRNKAFARIEGMGSVLIQGTPGSEHVRELLPTEGEYMVTKRRVGAHFNTDLETILSALEATHLVMCGVATSGVILSTLRWAADADYEITVIRDGVADGNDVVHDALLNHVFPSQADVLTADEWIKSMSS